jgi:hypothetical protein
MSLLLPKRTRTHTSNNRITTGFRVSDELWIVLLPLLPTERNPYRFGDGGPRVPDRDVPTPFFTCSARAADGKTSTRPSCVSTPMAAQLQGMCLDKGYDSQEASDILEEFGCTAHMQSCSEEVPAIKT